eukprot:c27513_g1_i2 orf=543-2864(+)
MGEKCFKSANGTSPVGCCDMNVKCRCKWRWDSSGICSYCHDKVQHRICSISSAFVFFLSAFIIFGFLGTFYAWLTFSPFERQIADSTGLACQEDNEGSWAIGVFYGDTPFSLRPIELENIWSDRGSAWPIANPVLTCASVSDASHPSNFVADPFLYIQGSKLYVFYETKNAITKQGDIGVAESLDGGASWQHLGIALDEEWHLSHPYVFKYNGQIYMMPEGSEKGDIRLYRALEFPLKWTLERVLINKPLVDATLVEYKGLFWLFASDFERFGAKKNGELEIWYAHTPFGPWRQHKSNPVHNGDKSSGARNGGRPFIHEGYLYRIGQDCGETYGQRIRLFRIQVLTKEKFREVELPFRIEGSKKGRNVWNGLRYHHLDVQKLPTGQWIAVMDGDKVPSGDPSTRYLLGSMAFLVLILLILLLGVILGVVQCVFPLGKCLRAGKRSDTSLLWVHPHVTSRLHRALFRLNRGSTLIRGRIHCSTCGCVSLVLVCVIFSVLSVCFGVKFLFGGNGAEEPYPVDGQYSQFTLLTMTYEARLWNLKMYIKHYSRCASVREIVVVWNKGEPPNPLFDFDSAVPVSIRREEKNSLNNRFKVDPQIKTRAVFELDDDIMVTCNDLERAFKAWREHPDRIVGFYPRLVDGNPLKYRNERYARNKKRYNMVLTGAAVLDGKDAFLRYWGNEADQGRALVDKLFNCEDILLNFILANSTSPRSVEYIHPTWAVDTSKLSSAAISRDTHVHYSKRTDCLLRFSELYGGFPLKQWDFGTRSDGWDY